MTDNAIDDASCDQLMEWSRLPVPLELKDRLRVRVAGRWLDQISGELVETAPDLAMRSESIAETKIEAGVMCPAAGGYFRDALSRNSFS
jgi:hypothetical protein